MDYEIKRQPMKSASGEVEVRTFRKVESEKSVWYISTNDASPASHIYVASKDPEVNKKSQGFAGRTITFNLEDGSVDKVQGPWHTNSDSLYKETGVDLRDQHLTFGVIGKGYEGNLRESRILNVLHKDEDWTLGEFNRIQKLAQALANKLGEELYVYQQSQGGSSQGPVKPEKEGAV